ncbi:MAG: peptide methionine sulfoxide reductase [Verrucomicrobiaceae bacterium]|nr:MAG: peptide methionine sulfoxide reductase [Verrucomicrobiaceae bacterium]
MNTEQIGLGGSCHWCTESIFQSVRGVGEVRQGWISSTGDDSAPSEAVLVAFNPEVAPRHLLIAIHLATHASTSRHSFRNKYRSAIYVFTDQQASEAGNSISSLERESGETFITRVLPFVSFTENRESLLNYYRTRPDAPFCSAYIIPKLALLRERFPSHFIGISGETPL